MIIKSRVRVVLTSPRFWLNVGSAVVAMATWFLAHPGMGFVAPETERQIFYWLGLVVAAGNAVHQYVYAHPELHLTESDSPADIAAAWERVKP